MIGNNLRRIRKKNGLSQEKLARLADISLNTLVGNNRNDTKSNNGGSVGKNLKIRSCRNNF